MQAMAITVWRNYLNQVQSVKSFVLSPVSLTLGYSMNSIMRARSNWNWFPQGNLACRIQAAGMGLGAVFTPTGFGTLLADGKETRHIDGKDYVLEYPIKADFALIKAHQGDRWGNLVYNKSARNFGPIMAMAADVTIAQVSEVVELGQLDPEHIITPGIFVQHVVAVDAANSNGE